MGLRGLKLKMCLNLHLFVYVVVLYSFVNRLFFVFFLLDDTLSVHSLYQKRYLNNPIQFNELQGG